MSSTPSPSDRAAPPSVTLAARRTSPRSRTSSHSPGPPAKAISTRSAPWSPPASTPRPPITTVAPRCTWLPPRAISTSSSTCSAAAPSPTRRPLGRHTAVGREGQRAHRDRRPIATITERGCRMTIPESRTTPSAAVVAVLLADGWHRATLGSFTIGPLSLGDPTRWATASRRRTTPTRTGRPFSPARLTPSSPSGRSLPAIGAARRGPRSRCGHGAADRTTQPGCVPIRRHRCDPRERWCAVAAERDAASPALR
jgi:hypothetical protein